MSTDSSVSYEASGVEASIQSPPALKRQRWFELALVLSIAVGEFFFNSLAILNHGPAIASSIQSTRYVGGLFREALSLLLLAYVLSRRGLKLRDLGVRWSFRSLLIGIGVAIACYVVYLATGIIVIVLQHFWHFQTANSGIWQQLFQHPSIWAIPFFLLNPFFEELVVRAYLMTEIAELTGSWLLAILISSLVQASYHLYYGWIGAGMLFVQFLVLSIYYARTRNAMSVIIAHGIFDLYGLMRVW